MHIQALLAFALFLGLCMSQMLGQFRPFSAQKIATLSKSDPAFGLALDKMKSQVKQFCGIETGNVIAVSYRIVEGVQFDILLSSELGPIQAIVVVRYWEEATNVLSLKFADNVPNSSGSSSNTTSSASPSQNDNQTSTNPISPTVQTKSTNSQNSTPSNILSTNQNVTNTQNAQPPASNNQQKSLISSAGSSFQNGGTASNVINSQARKTSLPKYLQDFHNTCEINKKSSKNINAVSQQYNPPASIQQAALNANPIKAQVNSTSSPPRLLQVESFQSQHTEYRRNMALSLQIQIQEKLNNSKGKYKLLQNQKQSSQGYSRHFIKPQLGNKVSQHQNKKERSIKNLSLQ